MLEPHASRELFSLLWWTGLTSIVVFVFGKCFYNLFWHPLSEFPGPKLAALGSLYEFWFDVVKDGQYLWEIERMHNKYGPIVRVNARELHIRDSHYYSTIYSGGARKVNKDAHTVAVFGAPSSVLATVDHNHHRARRSYLNPYFSKRSVIGMEERIHERIGKLCDRLDASIVKGEVVPLDSAFSALTADVVTELFYGEHLNYLNNPDYKAAATNAALGITLYSNWARFVPWLMASLKKMPIFLLRIIFPAVAELFLLQKEMKQRILCSLNEENRGKSSSIIVRALGDVTIPPAERGIDRLMDEATIVILAGTETTSRALSVGLFYVLHEKAHLMKIREELNTLSANPDKYCASQLEQLPYLNGVVYESLRLSFGPLGRLPRVAAEAALHYGGHTIPPGTPVSQSTYFVHTDPEIYPNPFSFDPTRWIKAAQEGFVLNKFLVSFTKGSRQCIGIQMAIAELYLTIARLARSFDMELHETTLEDVKPYHIRILGYPKKAKCSQNVRGEVMVKVRRVPIR